MKNLKIYLLILFISTMTIGCNKKVKHFNGEIILVNDLKQSDTLIGKKINFDGAYFGMITVFDSVIFFFHPRLPDFQYYCFNIKTGKHVANYFPNGNGQGEFHSITPIIQKYEEDGNQKSVFVAINESKAGVFNITKSIEQRKTVIDTLFPFKWRENFVKPFLFVFKYDDSTFIAQQGVARINNREFNYTLPQYVKINRNTNKIMNKYIIYKNPIINSKAGYSNEDLFQSYDIISPDRSKVAIGMIMMAQINILDLKTKKIIGVRISGTPDFEYLERNDEELRIFYNHLAADNRYIYALYVNKKYSELKESVYSHTINVFDWNGNFIHKLYLNNAVDYIDVDSKNRLLYGINLSSEEVYQYKLAF